MTTEYKRYKHAQRSLEAVSDADVVEREQIYSNDTKRWVATLEDGTLLKEGGYTTRYAERWSNLATFLTAAGANNTNCIISTEITLTQNTTIPANVHLEFKKGGSIVLDGYTFTVNGSLSAGDFQIFSDSAITAATADIFLNTTGRINARWFGVTGLGVADETDAIQKAIIAGLNIHAIVYIPAGNYLVTDTITVYNGTQITGVSNFSYWDGYSRDPKATRINFEPSTSKDLFQYEYTGGGTSATWLFLFHTSIEKIVVFGNANARRCLVLDHVTYATYNNLIIKGFDVGILCNATINNKFTQCAIEGCRDYNVWYRGYAETTDVWDTCTFNGEAVAGGSPTAITHTGVKIGTDVADDLGDPAGNTINIRFTNCLWESIREYGMDIDQGANAIEVINGYSEDVSWYSTESDSCMFRVGFTTNHQLANGYQLKIHGGSFSGAQPPSNSAGFLNIDNSYGVVITGYPSVNRFTFGIQTIDDVTGLSITSITRSGSTATVTTAVAHGITNVKNVTISGATQTDYNGTYTVTQTGASTFTYTVANSPATPATGTILYDNLHTRDNSVSCGGFGGISVTTVIDDSTKLVGFYPSGGDLANVNFNQAARFQDVTAKLGYYMSSTSGSIAFSDGGEGDGANIKYGVSSPEGAVNAKISSLYLRSDGSTNTSLYTKESDGTVITAGAFIVGQPYKILTVGTTPFTSIGASANTIGIEFTATGVGTGTGTAYKTNTGWSPLTSVDSTPSFTDVTSQFGMYMSSLSGGIEFSGSGGVGGGATIGAGAGSPEGARFGQIGSIWLNGSVNAGKTLWVKESVTGTNFAITSITSVSTTATVTTTAPHGIATENYVVISGAVETEYNGIYLATQTGASTFTYTFAGSATSPATGTKVYNFGRNGWKPIQGNGEPQTIASADMETTAITSTELLVTGTTNFDQIDITGLNDRHTLCIRFTGILTIAHGTAASGNLYGIKLPGSVNFTTATDDMLTLKLDLTGGFWYTQSLVEA